MPTSTTKPVKEGVPKEEAEKLQTQLEEAGAEVDDPVARGVGIAFAHVVADHRIDVVRHLEFVDICRPDFRTGVHDTGFY